MRSQSIDSFHNHIQDSEQYKLSGPIDFFDMDYRTKNVSFRPGYFSDSSYDTNLKFYHFSVIGFKINVSNFDFLV